MTPYLISSARAGVGRSALRCGVFVIALAAALLFHSAAYAFPPAPNHMIYGTVRDQYGTPLMTDQAQVMLVTPGGVTLTATVVPGLGFDLNYQLEVPMDAGLTADPYEPNALMAGAGFVMYVVLGSTTNLPIEMAGNIEKLGQPGQQSRIDLTLGVDANGDGIPDAWESAYLTLLGSNLGLGSVNAGSRLGHDKLTLRQEFLAGYYPYDPGDSLTLQILNANGNAPLLQFTATTGRYYSLLGSSDLVSWTLVSFRIPSDGTGALHTYTFATGIQAVQVQVAPPAAGAPPVLAVSRSGSQVTLSWPTNASTFSLVSSSSLKALSWTPVVATPSIVVDKYTLTVTPVGASQFYQLTSGSTGASGSGGGPFRYFKLLVQ